MRQKAPVKKVTLVLKEALLSEVKEIVAAEGLRSVSTFVEEAIADLVRRRRREQLRRAFHDASKDHLFLADVVQVGKDFEALDLDSLKVIR
jgi:hypothetical protein